MGSKVVREHESDYVPVEWGRTKNIIGPENFGSKYVKINITEYAPGKAHILHRHPGQEEVIYILEGEGITRTDEGDKPFGPGAFVFVPADTDHTTINVAKDKPIKAVIIKGPPEERGPK
jgi:quercetin dioxygenase-like cupin family protein